MKINFTRKEYAALVEMVLLADWVIHAHEVELTDESKPYVALRKKVLSHHREMGMEDAFQYAPGDDEYYETVDYEESSAHMAFIEAYEERSFWDTLAHKLAQRDLAAQETLTATAPLARRASACGRDHQSHGHIADITAPRD
jgi:hypothetical protein